MRHADRIDAALLLRAFDHPSMAPDDDHRRGSVLGPFDLIV